MAPKPSRDQRQLQSLSRAPAFGRWPAWLGRDIDQQAQYLGPMRQQGLLAIICLAGVLHVTTACPTGLAGEEVTSARCHYGTLPGGWLQTERRALLPEPADNSTHAVFPIWQPFCGKCQLKPLLTPYLAAADAETRGNSKDAHPLGLLLFGDSVDFRFVKYFCQSALGQEPSAFTVFDSGSEWLKLQGICKTPRMTIAKQHISAASLSGPYWADIDFSPLLAIPHGFEMFEKAHGRAPDVVSIASNFWDISREFAIGGMRIDGTILQQEFLPDDFMRHWMNNFTTILTYIKERVPEDTLLVYHTLHVPHQSADLGMWENDPFLSQHVKQLNAAGRHVAQSLHYHVIDIEAMAAQVSKGTLLVDNTHPGPDFMMQVLNVLLNMEQGHREALQAARKPASKLAGYLRWQQEKLSGHAIFKGHRRLR